MLVALEATHATRRSSNVPQHRYQLPNVTRSDKSYASNSYFLPIPLFSALQEVSEFKIRHSVSGLGLIPFYRGIFLSTTDWD